MSLSTTSYFSNSLVGVPQVAGENVDIYASDSAPKFAIGTKFERQDGAVFRYAHFAGAASQGQLLATIVSDSTVGWATTNTCIAPSSTYQMPDEQGGVYPGSLGSRYVIINSTATVNTYAGAYLITVASTGRGYQYRIRGNSATGTPATGNIRVQLYDQLQAAVAGTTGWIIVGCKYNDLTICPVSTADGIIPAGIKCVGTTSSTNTWGWIQTKGIAGVISDGTSIKCGAMVTASSNLAGAIGRYTTTTTATPGINIMDVYPVVGIGVTPVSAGASSLSAVALVIE